MDSDSQHRAKQRENEWALTAVEGGGQTLFSDGHHDIPSLDDLPYFAAVLCAEGIALKLLQSASSELVWVQQEGRSLQSVSRVLIRCKEVRDIRESTPFIAP